MGKRRIPKTPIAERMSDLRIDGMLYMQEQGRKEIHLSKAMKRPAYAHTSMEQKTIFKASMCEPCGYYREPDVGKDKDCCFPWFDPKDYDMAAYDYLPCKEGLTYEED